MTKRFKIQGCLLIVAAAALAWDRFTDTEKKTAAPADLLLHSTSTAASTPHDVADEPSSHLALGDRLAQIATVRGLDPEMTESAFLLGAGWLPSKSSKKSAEQPASVKAAGLAAEFEAHHSLNAVLTRDRGGYAIVNGQGLCVGQQRDGFKLIAVTSNTAIFAQGMTRIELKITGGVVADGPVISNASPEEAAVGTQTVSP